MSRKLNLADFRGNDDEEEEDMLNFLPKKQLELNDLKSRTFTHGITKKSKKDLEREAEERKRKEEEEALAKVNAELEDMINMPSGGMYAFGQSSGGPGAAGRMRGMGGGFVRAGGEGYAPAPIQPAYKTVPTGPSKMPPQGPSAMGYAKRNKSPSPPRSSAPKPKGKRAMDSFLEEIKNNQEARDSRLGHLAKQEGLSVTALAAWEHNPAARFKQTESTVEVTSSTNVMVSNLPPNVTDESLGQFCAKCGPVGTVKIMWPRGAAELQAARSGRASIWGFVNFMNRESAARAINELDKVTWGGAFLRLSWGAPMPLPLKPIYGRMPGRDRSERSPSPHRRDREDSERGASRRSRSRSREMEASRPSGSQPSQPPPAKRRRSSRTPSRSPSRSPSPPRKKGNKDLWLNNISNEQESFVRAVGKRVKDHGKKFEDMLKEKEKDNPKFAFLTNEEMPEYHLYRYTIDSRYRFPTPVSETFDDGGYASCYSSDSAEDSERERTTKGKIGRLARKRFESILRSLSGKRVEIARAMEFAVRHAEAADEVAEIVCKSLKVEQTPVPRKVARLHLVSDILHNSASPLPNVWKYRMAFESRLPAVFAHLANVHESLLAYSGQISADVFKGQVGAVLEIWESWIVFTQEASDVLRALLSGTTTWAEYESAKNAASAARKAEADAAKAKVQEDERKEQELAGKGFKSSGFKSSFKRVGNVEQEAEDLMNDVLAMGQGEGGKGGDDLDGEEMDLDGEEMDLDGEEMDEDLDGEAM